MSEEFTNRQIKKMICTQCPKGCALKIDIQNGLVMKVSGNQCSRGEKYARQELENPLRVLTSMVRCAGLELHMAPIRTPNPIPKAKMLEAMKIIRDFKLTKPVNCGEVIIKNILETGVDVIVTRTIK